ncbi:ATP-dependent Clp protease ATP-binding subunit [Candidatus Gracilibacteria bacterium]|nr:ATP-dependent Clp protease ATP-binding subunit [Candidatus Gracilibacteria bacterium]
MNGQGKLTQNRKNIIGKEFDITENLDDEYMKLNEELMQDLDLGIAGQQEAKKAIVETLLTGIFSLEREGALGAIFLGGPTGVGKTGLVKVLAKTLFGDENGFVRIPCELLKHPPDVSILTGSVPGFIGYGDVPRLSEIRVHEAYKRAKENKKLHPIIEKNYGTQNISIVLLDESEKAHIDILLSLLGAIQDGRMEMSSGKEGSSNVHQTIKYSRWTDLRNTLFIITSNIGEAEITQSNSTSIGFTKQNGPSATDYTTFLRYLSNHFPPEFLGRMNHIVRCHPIDDTMAREVINLSLRKLNDALTPYYEGNFVVGMSPSYREHILDKLSPEIKKAGARPIIRLMDQVCEKIGLAIHRSNTVFPKGFSGGRIEFDYDKKEKILLTPFDTRLQKVNYIDENERHQVVNQIVEERLSESRKMIDTYLRLIGNYDTNFFDAVIELEKRLQEKLGFTETELKEMRISVFLNFHDTVETPSSQYEIITQDENTFDDVSVRGIRRMIDGFVRQGTSVGAIYDFIYGFVGRPLTQNELRFIGYYMHRQEMKRHVRNRRDEQ